MAEEFLRIDIHNEFAQRMKDENAIQNKRLDKLEKTVEEITKLTISVEKMAISMENMTNELKSQGARLKEIETKPAKNWDKLIWIIVSSVIGVLVGALAVMLGLK